MANTFDIEFGSLYGAGRDTNPTRILDGTGELSDELVGGEFYWVCLDQSLDNPSGLHVFNVSTSPEVLTNGFWDSGATLSLQTNAATILGAVANIYYNYESDILTDFSGYKGGVGGAGYAFQSAVWALTTGFKYGYWEGELTSEKIDTIVAWYYPGDPSMDLTRTYLYSALDGTAAQGKQVYYGNAKIEEAGDSELQSVMLFKAVPEPSSVLLMLGAAGAIGVLSRRRMRL
jgi:hypothetical protein